MQAIALIVSSMAIAVNEQKSGGILCIARHAFVQYAKNTHSTAIEFGDYKVNYLRKNSARHLHFVGHHMQTIMVLMHLFTAHQTTIRQYEINTRHRIRISRDEIKYLHSLQLYCQICSVHTSSEIVGPMFVSL